MKPNVRMSVLTVMALGLFTLIASTASAGPFSGWGPAKSAEQAGGSISLNTEALEGCPIESVDGRSIFFASDRPGGEGGIDIWIANRASPNDPWGEPWNPGAPVNSEANDFCPTPLTGNRLFFVSTRGDDDVCGGPDIYETRFQAGSGWMTPVNLGCEVNSSAAEFSPSIVNLGGVPHLYFSSNRAGGFSSDGPDTDHDIYVSRYVIDPGNGAAWTPAELVPGLNTAYEDARPNVSKDGREIVFDSTRPGGEGGSDIWSADRSNQSGDWNAPVNLGPNVNSSSGESRASLSRDGRRLIFGSNRPGGDGNSDIYVSTRNRAN